MTRAPSRIKLARNRAPAASMKVRPSRSRRTRSGDTWDVLQADSSSPIQGQELAFELEGPRGLIANGSW